MKKSLFVISVLVILMLIGGLIVFKMNNKKAENNVEAVSPIGSAIQQAMYDQEQQPDTAKNDEKQEESAQKSEDTSKVSVIKKAVKTVQRKLSHETAPAVKEQKVKENLLKETTNESEGRKFTPEEEELLKKIPRSEEIVVDKEIKVKSSGKYLFK